jgi:hypothetical protein
VPRNRGAIPLALLVLAALVGGIVVATARIGEEELPRAQPPPAVQSPTPEVSPSPFSPEPTQPSETLETVEPTPEPTEATPTPEQTPLARTGGPVVPWFGGGLMLIGASVLVWRFSRAA